ncbi:CDP-diacylglycerol--glycerol-3-phosphate 3-phosphatidyltransferase, mitochondrial [Venturia canescens]|uniref:CDP-diacylglycerol--glycerol-3-phosphate 3-phosphatidyltransferase, mitochondrial n=1 Tax=Venturia canescens TaxID=32260 RepID=UPI001C9C4974|nr:CDP-diacylglycerol--glycerol-3-phosphate 3-phosphatidyltransferase, mitochondrial [Venturia canescens]
MNNQIFKALKRLHKCGSSSVEHENLRIRSSLISTIRNKINVAMLDEVKYPDDVTVHSELSHNLTWLHKVAPGFKVDGSKITVIHEPNEFYSTLITECEKAKSRITLASLYLGTGPLENALVDTVKKAIDQSNGKLRVTILLDYTRGTRGKCNSKTTLQPLLQGKWSYSSNIFLYHTPKLRGILKRILPHRFNELIGLQHMKLYLFDDTLIISGANLSNDYFTNRQDRYFVIRDCKDLCDFYDSLVERISEVSFRVIPEQNEPIIDKGKVHPLENSCEEFARVAAAGVRSLFQSELDKRSNEHIEQEMRDSDTWIFPLVEMGQFDIHHDSKVTLRLLQSAPPGSTLRLATGYFNLTYEYTNAILHYCRATCHLLTAHPTANGFFGAKGVAGAIPAAYTTIEKSFYKKSEKLDQSDRINLWEFVRPGWTYHAKGLWYTLPGHTKPSLTLIGSSNFGYRSVKRDLETQVAIVTKNEKLQQSLKAEHERLFDRSKLVTRESFKQPERIAPAWVCAAVIFFRYYF